MSGIERPLSGNFFSNLGRTYEPWEAIKCLLLEVDE